MEKFPDMREYHLSQAVRRGIESRVDEMLRDGLNEAFVALGERERAIFVSRDPDMVVGTMRISKDGVDFYAGIKK
ncbi:MAG: hypothetical protein KC736_05155 [Candidatus Moranbacteria bacterium]|nr:hypothetical protein [Candidatus Moranbacteria bacterium]